MALATSNGLALPAAEFTETSLTLAPGTTFDQWLGLMDTLGRIERAHQWWEGDALNQGEQRWGEKYAQAVGEGREKTAQDYAWVASRVQITVRTVNLPWNHHRVVALLSDDPEPQAYWLAMAEAEEWSKRDLAKAIKRAYLVEAGTVAGEYEVIYADPPWLYGDDLIEGYGAAEHHYPSLPTDEIGNLKVDGRLVPDLAASDAVLFLWATSPLLEDALAVIARWGFDYKASFVWDKVRHNFGHYNSVRHEFLLIATRGQYPPQAETLELADSVVSIERTEHSAKPEQFRDIIAGLYPGGRRLELFARQDVEGWDSWGAA
jgi:N6-adenosine-specific RNA methylase IME4